MYDRHSLKSKIARVTAELEETKDQLEEIKDQLESVNSIVEHNQQQYEWRLQRKIKTTKSEQEAKFQERIDILQGDIGEMTSDIERKMKTLEIITLIFCIIVALTITFLSSKVMLILYLVLCLIYIIAKAFFMHNKFYVSLPLLKRLFNQWKVILLPHYKNTLVNAFRTVRQEHNTIHIRRFRRNHWNTQICLYLWFYWLYSFEVV